jgi:serine beta-lactamase-like protein LACTB
MSFLQRLWQEGYLSFDKPVQDYVPEFPEKRFDGEKVKIYFMLHTNVFM